ncbi:MAG TPA: aldo/keto reductase [Bryobacteraceae bacterium]|nr:aldo/keto reductase [Bryobacteraceae bacterium]
MTLRILGKTDMRITPIGIGAWAIGGGKWEFGWGAQNDSQSVAAIRAGLDRGVNWIDTAAVYGLGHSERVVGAAVRELSIRPYIFTKCSLVWDESGNISHNLRADSIRREAEASLKRLGIDAIDLYQIHWPAWKGGHESASPGSIEEAVGVMAKLKNEGKIRHIGVSNFNSEQMERAQKVAPIASLQPQYSLLAREVEDSMLPYCLNHRIGVIVYSPMASGMLSGAMTRERIESMPEDDWRKDSANFKEPLLSRNLRLVETLRAIGGRYDATPGEIAIAWTLRNAAVTGAIVGVRSAEQVKGIAGAADIQLSVKDVREIESGLTARAA